MCGGAQKEGVGAKCGVQQMFVALCPAEVLGRVIVNSGQKVYWKPK